MFLPIETLRFKEILPSKAGNDGLVNEVLPIANHSVIFAQ